MKWDPYNPTVDMDRIAELATRMLLRLGFRVPVVACGSGGGCATIYAGWPYLAPGGPAGDYDAFTVLGGCGSMGSPNWCYVEDFSVGYDQDLPEADRWGPMFLHPEPVSREERAALAIVLLYREHPRAICRTSAGFRTVPHMRPLTDEQLDALGYLSEDLLWAS